MPGNEKRPAAGDGRALREFGLADLPDSTTSELIVDPADDWARRIREAADAFMTRKHPARRHRGRR